MPRYELPAGLSPEEERVAIAAIEWLLERQRPRLNPWTLAGRADNLRIGSLHVRHQTDRPWGFHHELPLAPGGTGPRVGRGDSR